KGERQPIGELRSTQPRRQPGKKCRPIAPIPGLKNVVTRSEYPVHEQSEIAKPGSDERQQLLYLVLASKSERQVGRMPLEADACPSTLVLSLKAPSQVQ